MDISAELRDILLRNGMQAHIIANGDKYQLAVQGHDSPLLTYDLTQKQLQALTDWGTNSANRKAWNVFTSIVAGDFDMPRNFVHARNANGRVAMGLHGYRIGVGEYGRETAPGMWGPGVLGWTPRRQDGMHLRRVGGQVFLQGAPIVAERPNRRLKPGELLAGNYGFYYKNQQTQQAQGAQQASQEDVLQNLQSVITPIEQTPRSQEPAIPYSGLITSDVYFSNEKWQECLKSHGIIIDEQAKTLTIQSGTTDVDMVYDLKPDELKALTDNSIKSTPIATRLEILNNVIGEDFSDKITMDMLNDIDRVNINLRPEVLQQLQQQSQQAQQNQQEQQTQPNQQQAQPTVSVQKDLYTDENSVDGRDVGLLNENKYWAREGRHGREVEVTGITAYRTDVKGQYVMTAQINGQTVSHEISQKQYDKFMALDDYHRMKLFAKIFPEVDLKNRPGTGANLGSQILGALTAGAVVAGEVIHGLHRPHHGDGPAVHPDGPAVRVYGKPGVDSPNDIAARNFEAMANHAANDMRRGY